MKWFFLSMTLIVVVPDAYIFATLIAGHAPARDFDS